MSKFAQYLICKNRGHQPDNSLTVGRPVYPKKQCRHCGTVYWTEERETNVPTPPQQDKP